MKKVFLFVTHLLFILIVLSSSSEARKRHLNVTIPKKDVLDEEKMNEIIQKCSMALRNAMVGYSFVPFWDLSARFATSASPEAKMGNFIITFFRAAFVLCAPPSHVEGDRPLELTLVAEKAFLGAESVFEASGKVFVFDKGYFDKTVVPYIEIILDNNKDYFCDPRPFYPRYLDILKAQLQNPMAVLQLKNRNRVVFFPSAESPFLNHIKEHNQAGLYGAAPVTAGFCYPNIK